MLVVFLVKLPSGDCHYADDKSRLVKIMAWLYLCRYTASLGHNGYNVTCLCDITKITQWCCNTINQESYDVRIWSIFTLVEWFMLQWMLPCLCHVDSVIHMDLLKYIQDVNVVNIHHLWREVFRLYRCMLYGTFFSGLLVMLCTICVLLPDNQKRNCRRITPWCIGKGKCNTDSWHFFALLLHYIAPNLIPLHDTIVSFWCE